jgi:hypothetical protein
MNEPKNCGIPTPVEGGDAAVLGLVHSQMIRRQQWLARPSARGKSHHRRPLLIARRKRPGKGVRQGAEQAQEIDETSRPDDLQGAIKLTLPAKDPKGIVGDIKDEGNLPGVTWGVATKIQIGDDDDVNRLVGSHCNVQVRRAAKRLQEELV